ncbi:hypothetical protein N431DRAFT_440019 [Stipitochalara longipes BDJ]|nr:hypothetical protein N431DRAFT_440019 [Stipitochalara longipes BDJ]
MTKPWVDGPYPLLATPKAEGVSAATLKVATDMCFVHNLFTRSINSIVLQYEQVEKKEDVADFLVYLQSWHESVHHHHDVEEKYFFPDIENYTGEKGIMEKNIKQHDMFHGGLKDFGEYVYSVKPQDWDKEKFGEMLKSIVPPLMTHLQEEIPTLLALDKYGGDKLIKAWEDLEKKALSGAPDLYRAVPFAQGLVDPSFDPNQQSPFPWFMPIISQLWLSRRYKGAWRFSPCTLFGKHKELPFAVAKEI